MTKLTSAFESWFVAQHGKRPSDLPIDELVAMHNQARRDEDHTRYLLAQVEMWEEKKTSALYAWNAAPKLKDRA